MEAARSIHAVKGAYDRLVHRVANMKKTAEKAAEATSRVLLTNGTIAGFAYANETFGTAPADDATGLREVDIMGAPVDLMAGVALTGLSLFGMFGKYDSMALDVGNGGLGAFSYRFAAEWARKRRAAAGTTSTTTTTTSSGRAFHGRPQGTQAGARTHAYVPAP